MTYLGGHAQYIDASTTRLGAGEAVRDVAKMYERYARGVARDAERQHASRDVNATFYTTPPGFHADLAWLIAYAVAIYTLSLYIGMERRPGRRPARTAGRGGHPMTDILMTIAVVGFVLTCLDMALDGLDTSARQETRS